MRKQKHVRQRWPFPPFDGELVRNLPRDYLTSLSQDRRAPQIERMSAQAELRRRYGVAFAAGRSA
jgi:hypothetical protein